MAEQPTFVPNPKPASLNKNLAGLSDMYIEHGVYKFMGCSVLSINMTLGFNGTAGSVSLSLVEDTANGDKFIEPAMPSLWAISLPKGGVGAPILYPGGVNLNPDGFFPKNTPFYFCGLCTNWSRTIRDIGGNIISVSLVDPREVLSGVLCLLGSFSLTTQIGSGGNLDNNLDIRNIIDVFGYFGYGMQSGKNDYGIQWSKIVQCLENSRVTLHGISYEFRFNGDPFLDTPSWYRIDETSIDIVGLCAKVARDSGADFIMVSRKASNNEVLVELRSIDRTNTDPLTKTEIDDFVSSRSSIVSTVRKGKEQRTEPTSSVVVGGMVNSQYIALPTQYEPTMHVTGKGFEDYNSFPPDIKTRLFGGIFFRPTSFDQNILTTFEKKTFTTQSGAIFPCWGFTPDDHAYPLIEPVLFLDHLVFDKISNDTAKLKECVPSVKISIKMFNVRQVPHGDLFLVGDGDHKNDLRPFAYLEKYTIGVATPVGYIKGLPLNTEVLRAALVSQDAFYALYSIYYPDIAKVFCLPRPDWKALQEYVTANTKNGIPPDISKISMTRFMKQTSDVIEARTNANMSGANGQLSKTLSVWNTFSASSKRNTILFKFRQIIYDLVRQYALDWMGKRFLVCLPKSFIMGRIWFNLPVPTRPEKPQIEYIVDQKGYFDRPLPADFTKIADLSGQNSSVYNINYSDPSVEQQVRRRFMADDGRFYPMVVVDWKPKGNINFNSNGSNKAMFQDLPPSDFRPNRIATGNPDHVFVSCSVNQLVKRPDLALVDFPTPISFDPQETQSIFVPFKAGAELINDEFIATKAGIMKYFWYFLSKDDDLRKLIGSVGPALGLNRSIYGNLCFSNWSTDLSYYISSNFFLYEHSTEIIMDFREIVIPLTSTFLSYGPWIADYNQAKGTVNLDVDSSLVPWNFVYQPDVDPLNPNPPPSDGLTPEGRLDNAGNEKLTRSLCVVDYLDSASIIVAGFPEFGPAQGIGYNSNLTGIGIDFGVGGVKTTYNLSTYSARPGTYRKSEYDNVSKARIDARERLPETINENIINTIITNPRNRFQD